MKSNFLIGAVILGCALIAPSEMKGADLIYGTDVICPGNAKCNGATWNAQLFALLDPNAYKIVITMDPGPSTPQALGAIALKDFYTGTVVWTSFTATGGTNNPTWNRFANELNANGCDGGGSNSLCAEANQGSGLPYSTVAPFLFSNAGGNVQFTWFFTATGGIFQTDSGSNTHLKYQFLAPAVGNGQNAGVNYYDKAGDLGSYDIKFTNYQCCDVGIPTTEQVVPEPSTYSLVAAAALAMTIRRKMKK